MQQVEADSQGRVKMGPGTLYGSIGRMTEARLVRESDEQAYRDRDCERRIDYQLTDAGRAAREAELGWRRYLTTRVGSTVNAKRELWARALS